VPVKRYCALPLQPYYFPVLDSTLDQRCLPLGYAFPGHEPNASLACDQPTCANNQNFDETTRLTCGHTFHKGCILAGDDEEPNGDDSDDSDDDSDHQDQSEESTCEDDDEDDFDEDFYCRQVKNIQKKAMSRFSLLPRAPNSTNSGNN